MEHKDTDFVLIHIDGDDCHTAILTKEDMREIEQYIVDQICVNQENQPYPEFRGCVFSDIEGALIINSHVDSVSWLKNVIRSYKKRALRIMKLKDIPRYTTRVHVDIPQVNSALELLKAHNFCLQSNVWRIVSCSDKFYDFFPVTLLIDDRGREMLERNNFKLFLGITPVQFSIIGGVERCETTGKLMSF